MTSPTSSELTTREHHGSVGTAVPPSRPVLIGGCPRSGTTLLGAMLGVGPDRLTVPESTFKLRLLPLVGRAGILSGRAASQQLRGDRLFRLWEIPAPTLDGPVAYHDLLSELVRRRAIQQGKERATLWIDHTPANIWRADELANVLPEARFIHLVRDGRAVAASLLGLDWGPNTVAGAAAWWSTWIAQGLAAERALGTDRVLSVRFEDLVDRPETTLRRVCDFIDTPFDHQMVARREYQVSPYTRGMHDLVDQGPDPTRIDAWRTQLTPYQLSAFERRTGDLLPLLGYPSIHGPHASLGSWPERLRETAQDFARRAVTDRARRAARRQRLRA